MLGFFAKALGLAPAAPEFVVPDALPKISAQNAAELAAKAGFDVPTGATDLATQTPAQFIRAKLNTEQDMLGSVKSIAHGLPEKDGIQWATDSADLVAAKLPPAQQEALAAAKAFQASPSLATRDAAAAAAEKAGPLGPGGLAAKAVSFATVAGAPVIKGGDKAIPALVTGAVVLAAALSPKSAKPIEATATPVKPQMPAAEPPKAPVPVPPVERGSAAAARNATTFKPFIERGLKIAAG